MDQQTNMNMPMTPEKHGPSGLLIGIIVILILVIVGAIYFWKQNDEASVDMTNTEAITNQSSSDDTASIETDLQNTDIDNVDAELNAS